MINYINKKALVSLVLAILLPCVSALAQTDVDLDTEFGGRLSLGLDKKIVKGLNLSLEEEVRMADNFGSLGRLQTTVGLKYKALPYLRLGVGYVLINPYDSESGSFSSLRHRFIADATGSLKVGDWTFSLKERFQATRRTGQFNEYQNPATALMLKSRLMAKYRLGMFEPYAYFELRHYLNAPVIKATTDGTNYYTSTGSRYGEAGWFLDGFNGCYANRYRTSVGVDINISKRHAVELYLLADYISDKKVDANAEGTKLKSYTAQKGWVMNIGAAYVFSF